MNAKQAAAVEWLRKEILAYDGLHRDNYEYKKFDVVDHSFFVEVYTVVGLVGDENTLAEFCRTRRQIFIGKRGGMRLMNAARYNKFNQPEATKPVHGKRVAYWLTI